jgi:hypothetical protein
VLCLPAFRSPCGWVSRSLTYRSIAAITISADRWPDHIRLSDIEPNFTCTACGKRGADVRSEFVRARASRASGWNKISSCLAGSQQLFPSAATIASRACAGS